MKNKKWLMITAPIAAAILTISLYSAYRSPVQLTERAQLQRSVSAPPAAPATIATAETINATPAQTDVFSSSQEVAAGTEDSEKISFKVDAKGRIVTNEEARLNVEKLFALNTPAERAKKLRLLEESLPPTAARELADLMERYGNYQAAQYQTFPPGQEVVSTDDGLAQLDGLSGLRVQHFGSTVAEGFFGAEETMQRELLQLMSLDKDESLTLEEKAEKAQALYQSLPAIAAAEERGKLEAAAAQKR